MFSVIALSACFNCASAVDALVFTSLAFLDMSDNSAIANLLNGLANRQYQTGGYEQAREVVDQMDSQTLREYLKELITDNVKVGIEILRTKK